MLFELHAILVKTKAGKHRWLVECLPNLSSSISGRLSLWQALLLFLSSLLDNAVEILQWLEIQRVLFIRLHLDVFSLAHCFEQQNFSSWVLYLIGGCRVKIFWSRRLGWHWLLPSTPWAFLRASLLLLLFIVVLLLLESTYEVKDLVGKSHWNIDIEQMIHSQYGALAIRLLIFENDELDLSFLHQRLKEIQVLIKVVYFKRNHKLCFVLLSVSFFILPKFHILSF